MTKGERDGSNTKERQFKLRFTFPDDEMVMKNIKKMNNSNKNWGEILHQRLFTGTEPHCDFALYTKYGPKLKICLQKLLSRVKFKI